MTGEEAHHLLPNGRSVPGGDLDHRAAVTIGRSGLVASPVGLGCARLGSTLAACDGPAALALVRHALEAGVTLFDTADIYAQGNSERLLGAALGSRRSKAVIITKAGQRFTGAQRWAALAKRPIAFMSKRWPALRRGVAAQRARPLPRDISPAHIRRAIEGSLRRLGTDHIDIFLLHSPLAHEIAAQGEALQRLLGKLVCNGTLRLWGISCDDEAALVAALALPDLGVVQLPLRLALECPGLLRQARERGIGLVVREIYAQGGGLAAAAGIEGAITLVGTTNQAHLDDALRSAAALREGMERSDRR